MRSGSNQPRGALHTLWLDSVLLRNNPLGDDTQRQVAVYVPHGHDGSGLPLLVDLAAFLSGGPVHAGWKGFGENLCERLDRLIGDGTLPPVVVAMPDCFTRLGGNQYINNSVMGPWADVLRQEVVPLVESKFRCGGAGKRGVFGKSSGGYGAMVHALLYPDFWSAAASHSGDMGFELMFFGEFAGVLRTLSAYDMNIRAWLDNFFSKPKQKSHDLHTLLMLAMCASFDPDPSQPYGVRLPVDPHTCELIPERWHNFLRWDPLKLAEEHGAGLKKMKSLFFDCGTFDQYNLLYGARRLHRMLEQRGIAHTYEEFKDDHNGLDYRLDRSLPVLVKALTD